MQQYVALHDRDLRDRLSRYFAGLPMVASMKAKTLARPQGATERRIMSVTDSRLAAVAEADVMSTLKMVEKV